MAWRGLYHVTHFLSLKPFATNFIFYVYLHMQGLKKYLINKKTAYIIETTTSLKLCVGLPELYCTSNTVNIIKADVIYLEPH